jgi:predicted phage tail protein
MRLIRVYGRLAKELGQHTFRADVSSVAEAVRFLIANFPHLEVHMVEQHYRVRAGRHILTEDEIHYPVGAEEVITITPVLSGAGAIGRIIVGALLVAASFFIPGTALLAGIALKSIAFGIGASLVLGGVAQLLAPTPQTSQEQKDPKQKSYSFSGIQNVSRAGLPIPIVYGETVVGSIVVSAGVSTERVKS